MKALIRKDLYLFRQVWLFLIIIVVFAVIPNSSMSVFATVYAAMIPYMTIAFDEQSKWDQLAAMMPYSILNLVLSKFLMGYALIVCAAVLSLLAGLVWSTASPLMPLLGACVGLVMMAITMPLIFWLGVEKGRMLFILLIVAVAVGASLLLNMGSVNGELISIGLPVLAVAFNAVSVPLSVRLYARHYRT
jgi:hypothetical protein